MGKIWKGVLVVWAFIADTAQIAGVDWKVVFGYAMGFGGSAWVIGFVTDVGPFPLTIGVLGAGFLAAGISAFSRYRRSPPPASGPTEKERFAAQVREKARENRAALVAPKPTPPKFAAPKLSQEIPVSSLSNQDLGELLIKSGKAILDFARYGRGRKNTEVVNKFIAEYVPTLFWLTDEARNRGLVNDHIASVQRNIHNLENVDQIEYLGTQTEKFGNIVKLYA